MDRSVFWITGSWAFVTFVYFKFALGAAFSGDMTVTGALVLGISFAAMVFGFTALYAKNLLPHNLGAVTWTKGRIAGRGFPVFLMFSVAFLVWSSIVLEGFASRVASDVRIGRLLDSGLDHDRVAFFLIMLGPVFLHYLFVVFSSVGQSVFRDPDFDGP